VLPEFVDKARALRELIVRRTPVLEEASDHVLRILKPRPAWPKPGRGQWYKPLIQRYRSIRWRCRLDLASRIEPHLRRAAGRRVNDQMHRVGRGRRAGAVGRDGRGPFGAEYSMISDIGLHAIARRYQRGWAVDDGSVLVDLGPLGYGWAARVRAGGEFRVEAPLGQGQWVAAVSRVDGRDLPVLLVRSFIGD
jgi:hypothetical protein